MANVVFILGLAASGKSYLADQMAEDHPYQVSHEGFLMPDQRERNLKWMIDNLRKGNDCIVIEGALMFKENQDEMMRFLQLNAPNAVVEWICFENNQEKAAINAWKRAKIESRRDAVGNIDQNARNSPWYHCPDGSTKREIVTDW